MSTTRYALVIDTEQYSGNFERQLCAFTTGQIGGCEVGDDYARLYDEPEPFENIEQRADEDDGCHRPCSIWPTPGWSNDGKGIHTKGNGPFLAYLSVAIFFHEQPTTEQVELIKRRSVKFNEAQARLCPYPREAITITGFRLVTITQQETSVAV